MRRGSIVPGGDKGARARITNSDGEFRFDSLAAVDYVFEFRKPGFETPDRISIEGQPLLSTRCSSTCAGPRARGPAVQADVSLLRLTTGCTSERMTFGSENRHVRLVWATPQICRRIECPFSHNIFLPMHLLNNDMSLMG